MNLLKKTAAASAILVAASLALPSGSPFALEDVKSRILTATKVLSEPPDTSFTKETLVTCLCELLDIATALSAGNPHHEEIRSRIAVAEDLIKKDSLFNSKARQYLSFAYRMMTNGRRFESPGELEDFVTPVELQEKSLRYMRGLIERAVQSLDAGDKIGTAVFLLEMVLLTVSPVQG